MAIAVTKNLGVIALAVMMTACGIGTPGGSSGPRPDSPPRTTTTTICK